MEPLLTRDEFRNAVFKRDGYKCVICGLPAVDAHHIMERRLFEDGGYYLSNGASLCSTCHLNAEMTTLSCEEIREAAGIKNIILPNHLYGDNDYVHDKWANIILPTGQRIIGELFHDESVQKILARGGVLDQFSKYVKYPRTLHLPFSEKRGKDDRVLDNVDHFVGREVVATLKMDGENCTWYRDYTHARSINSGGHPTRKMNKGLWSQVAYDIPEGWRVCGEDLYAKHTIHYKNLVRGENRYSYYRVFSIWNEKNECLSWDDTLDWCELLKLQTVPVLYRGPWDEKIIRGLNQPEYGGDPFEGFVVRVTDSFTFAEFRKSVAKFVRGTFEIKHGHWTQQKIEVNGVG